MIINLLCYVCVYLIVKLVQMNIYILDYFLQNLDELKLMVPTGIESHYFGVLVITCITVFISMMWISFGMFGKL